MNTTPSPKPTVSVMAPRARAFTLVELLVASTAALAMTGAALAVLLVALRTQSEGVRRAQLARDAQLVMDTIAYDLSYLGIGAPYGFQADSGGNVVGDLADPDVAARQLRPALRVAEREYLAFLGDAPFPNAELNGVMAVTALKGDASDDELAVSSEVCPCTPAAGVDHDCDCVEQSYLADLPGGDCAGGGELSCPWGLFKYQGGGRVPLVIGALDGTWYARHWELGRLTTDRDRHMIHLHHEVPPGFEAGAEPYTVPLDAFVGTRAGGGFVANLDRVFYSLERRDTLGAPCAGDYPCALRRKHCWGWDILATAPDAPGFPAAGAAPTLSPTDCAAPAQGTPWETLADDVVAFSLRYFDATGAELASPLSRRDLARARVVEVDLRLAGKNRSFTVEQRVTRRLYLEHGGGLVTDPRTPEDNGGCWQPASGGPVSECTPQ